MIILKDLLRDAEIEMKEMKQPYVGTEHFMLAFLKRYKNDYIKYDEFKKYVIEIIGSSHKESQFILYTPIMRKVTENCQTPKEAILNILSNDDAIAYNILLSKKIDIEGLYLFLKNTL